jgi:CRP-like cAMP-binding protein
MLPKEAFLDLLQGSPRMAEAMREVVHVRKEETLGILRRFR